MSSYLLICQADLVDDPSDPHTHGWCRKAGTIAHKLTNPKVLDAFEGATRY
jgi:hypothetical protein